LQSPVGHDVPVVGRNPHACLKPIAVQTDDHLTHCRKRKDLIPITAIGAGGEEELVNVVRLSLVFQVVKVLELSHATDETLPECILVFLH